MKSVVATSQIMSWLDEMILGRESAHSNSLYPVIDWRGSGVRLDIRSVLIAGRQSMP